MIAALRNLFRKLPLPELVRRDIAFFVFRHTGERLAALPAYQRYLREEKWPNSPPPADTAADREALIARYYATPEGPAMAMITHKQGGGTATHVNDLADRLEAESWRCFHLQRHDAGHLRITPRDYAHGCPLYFRWPEESEALKTSLRQLGITHLHLHHLVDFPADFIAFLPHAGIPYDVTIHDYFSICPRFTLFDEAVRGYCGEPEDVRKCSACVRHLGSPVGRTIDVARWRDDSQALLAAARQVFVPDADVAIRLKRYFPHVTFTLRPHPERFGFEDCSAPVTPHSLQGQPQMPQQERHDNNRNILILGGIAPHKGSKVLLDCAEEAQRRNLPLHFTLIGHSDLEKQLASLKNVTLKGRYMPHKLTGLLKAGNFHLALLPSVIPETYNYTLSECWKHGIFPVCLDIGAIAARIRATGQGAVLPYEWYYQPERLNDALLSMQTQPLDKESIRQCLQDYPSLTQDYYGFADNSA